MPSFSGLPLEAIMPWTGFVYSSDQTVLRPWTVSPIKPVSLFVPADMSDGTDVLSSPHDTSCQAVQDMLQSRTSVDNAAGHSVRLTSLGLPSVLTLLEHR